MNIAFKSLGETDVKSGYFIEFGIYWLDRRVFIGRLADINVWDRILTDQEMTAYSGCLEITSPRGNIVNDETPLNMTGKLVTAIDIPDSDVSCEDIMYYLHVPVRMGSVRAASDICDKMEDNSIAPRMDSDEGYYEFHNITRSSPAFRD